MWRYAAREAPTRPCFNGGKTSELSPSSPLLEHYPSFIWPAGLPDVSNSIGLRLFHHDGSKNYARKCVTNLLNVGKGSVVGLSLQRHLSVLTTFAHVESRLSSRGRTVPIGA